MDIAALETAIIGAITSGAATWGIKTILEERATRRLSAPKFSYSGSFQTAKVDVTSPKPPGVDMGEPDTRAKIPAGHRQFLPAKTSEELQNEFKKREEDAALPRASRWGKSSPSKGYAFLYVATSIIAIFTLLLITGRLPLR